jgi:hypothetical protein
VVEVVFVTAFGLASSTRPVVLAAAASTFVVSVCLWRNVTRGGAWAAIVDIVLAVVLAAAVEVARAIGLVGATALLVAIPTVFGGGLPFGMSLVLAAPFMAAVTEVEAAEAVAIVRCRLGDRPTAPVNPVVSADVRVVLAWAAEPADAVGAPALIALIVVVVGTCLGAVTDCKRLFPIASGAIDVGRLAAGGTAAARIGTKADPDADDPAVALKPATATDDCFVTAASPLGGAAVKVDGRIGCLRAEVTAAAFATTAFSDANDGGTVVDNSSGVCDCDLLPLARADAVTGQEDLAAAICPSVVDVGFVALLPLLWTSPISITRLPPRTDVSAAAV